MEVSIAGRMFNYPSSPDEVTLGLWVLFIRDYGMALDDQAKEAEAIADPVFRSLALMRVNVDRAYCIAAFFSGEDIETAKAEYKFQEVMAPYYKHYPSLMAIAPTEGPFMWAGEQWELPPVDLKQSSPFTFGEVVDSKAMLGNSKTLQWTRWELIRMLAAMFFRRMGEPYHEDLSDIEGERATAMEDLPLRYAVYVSTWYEAFNDALARDFTVFQGSSLKAGQNMIKHFDVWGWVNFLKSIAKTKVFDISGSGWNSIQCARYSKAFDVLMYASEDKEYTEASVADLPKQK